MKRLLSLTATLAAVLIFNVSTTRSAVSSTPPAEQAQAQAAPATQSDSAALPEGHPQLPSGHPQLPQSHPQLPSGHPAVPGQAAPGASVNGSLVVKVVQGTHDGQEIAGGQAVIRLFQRGTLIQKMTVGLDATGMATVESIPLSAAVQPVITMKYAGVTYQSVGRPMGPTDPDQLIRLKVYETTDTAPQWRIAMRHVMANQIDQHLYLTEVWAINNPTDRSYLGVANPNPSPQKGSTQPGVAQDTGRTTLTLPLPAGAAEVRPGQGFHGCCVKVEDGKVINTMPILPGTTEFRVDYMLSPEDGAFHLALTTPARTDHLMVILPDNGLQVSAQGLESGDPFEAGDQRFRMYSAKQVEPGAAVGLVIQAPQAAGEAVTGSAAAPAAQAGTIKLIAGGGVLLLVLAGTFVLLRPTKKTQPTGAAA